MPVPQISSNNTLLYTKGTVLRKRSGRADRLLCVFFRLLPQGASHTNRRNNLVVSEIVRIFADENEMKDK